MTIPPQVFRIIQLLRFPERSIIASIVGDSTKVRREIRFLLLRAAVFVVCSLVIITVSIFSIRHGVIGIEERYQLQQQLFSRFESMARLSHNVVDGRAALDHIRTFFPKDDNLLPFLNTIDALAKKTGNKSSFQFDQATSLPASGMEPYRFITYTITQAGDAQTFLTYLEAFYRMPYPVVIDTMSMQSGSGVHTEGSRMQLKGRLYVQ